MAFCCLPGGPVGRDLDAPDGGGLDFEFFWHPINQEPNETWHPLFKQALAFIRQYIKP